MERHEGVLLDDYCIDILQVIRRRDGASTTDLRLDDSIDLESNDRIRNRMHKLADAGLVDTRDAEYSVGGHPPTVAEVSDQQTVDDLLADPGRGADSLAARVDDLERDADDFEALLIAIARALEDNDIDIREYHEDA